MKCCELWSKLYTWINIIFVFNTLSCIYVLSSLYIPISWTFKGYLPEKNGSRITWRTYNAVNVLYVAHVRVRTYVLRVRCTHVKRPVTVRRPFCRVAGQLQLTPEAVPGPTLDVFRRRGRSCFHWPLSRDRAPARVRPQPCTVADQNMLSRIQSFSVNFYQ